MIVIQNAVDFEMYSANSAGGIQGAGYQCRNAGYMACLLPFLPSDAQALRPRLLRVVTSTSFSVHDLIFVDCKFTALR